MNRVPYVEVELAYGSTLKPPPEGDNETSIHTATVSRLHRIFVNSPEVDIFYNFSSWHMIDGNCRSLYFFCPCDCGLLVDDDMVLRRPTSVQIKHSEYLRAVVRHRELAEIEFDLRQRVRNAQTYVAGLSMEEAQQVDGMQHLLRAMHVPAIGQLAAEHNQQLPLSIFLNAECDLPTNIVVSVIETLEKPQTIDVARPQLPLQDDDISSSPDETHLHGHRAQRLVYRRNIVQSELVTSTKIIEESNIGGIDDSEYGEEEEDEEDGDDEEDGEDEPQEHQSDNEAEAVAYD